MRFMRIGNVYPEYWRLFYARNRALSRKTYAEQCETLFHDNFAQADSYCHALRKLGYHCEEVVANVEPLQRQWALENGVRWDPVTYVRQHPIEIARRFRPDVVMLNDFRTFDMEWVRRLRESCPSVQRIATWCASPLSSCECLEGCDLVLTSSPAILATMRRAGLPAELLRHAFDARILERIGAIAPGEIPLTFVGNVIYGDGFHGYRAEVLKRLVNDFEDVRLYCPHQSKPALETIARWMLYATARRLQSSRFGALFLNKIPALRSATRWQARPRFRCEDPIERRSLGAAFGLDMYRTLAKSLVTLNVHGDVAGRFSGNIRLFEATGVGAGLITDWKEDLPELFEPDREVVVFHNVQECVEKTRWLLDHPAECRSIAEAGQRRTLREHTYECRAAELHDLFRRMTK